MKKLLSACFIAITVSLHTGCGSDENNRTPAGNPVPPAPTSTPSPGNQPQGGEVPNTNPSWSQVHELFVGDMVDPTTCEFPWHFTVQNTGTFTAGPCTARDTEVTATITNTELTELNRRANAVANSNPSNPPQCEPFGAVGSDLVELMVVNDGTFRIFEYSPGNQSICYRGERANARELASYLNSLMRKYYPRRDT